MVTLTRRLPRLLFLTFVLTASLRAALPSVDDFVRRSDVAVASISEDGRFVAFLTPGKGEHYDLNLFDTSTQESSKLGLGGDDVVNYEWIDANRMIIATSHPPTYYYRLQVLDVAQRKVTANLSYEHQFFTLISSLRRDPDLFVALFYAADGGRGGLAIISTRLRPLLMAGQKNDRFNVKEWIDTPEGQLLQVRADADGEVRSISIYKDKQVTIYYRANPSAPWIALPLDYEKTKIIGFSADPDALYVSNLGEGNESATLHVYRIGKNEFGPALYEDPDYSMHGASIMGVRQQNGRVRPLALAYHRDLPVKLPLDPLFGEALAAVNAKLPGRLNIIVDCDWDLRRFVIASHTSREPPRHLVYDRQENRFMALASPTPWLDPAKMSVPRPIKFKSRDGLTLEGYLSLPSSIPAGHKPPLIAVPHGGPWIRDIWCYDAEVQFLTSRGYAVFQPNYRGSPGYRRSVSDDPMADFIGMHQDVTDGVKQLVSDGVVDGKRLAIYGASFGGYLALCGAAFEPELYRCAVTFAGVFDWKQLIRQESRSRYDKFSYEYYLRKLGTPREQQAHFEAISPIHRVSVIKAPVFVVHGKLDSTVDYQQSTRLLSELKKHKIPHRTLMFDTESHGFSERKNRRKFLLALEEFLAEHL